MAAKRKCFSIAEKASIIEKAKKFNETKVQLSKNLGIALSSLQTILKQQEMMELKSDKSGEFRKLGLRHMTN